MPQVKSLVLAGKKVNLPQSVNNQVARPIFFDENGLAYVFDNKETKKGRVQVKVQPTQAEVDALVLAYNVGYALEVS